MNGPKVIQAITGIIRLSLVLIMAPILRRTGTIYNTSGLTMAELHLIPLYWGKRIQGVIPIPMHWGRAMYCQGRMGLR